jgi:hypothetical protein
MAPVTLPTPIAPNEDADTQLDSSFRETASPRKSEPDSDVGQL